MTIITKEKMTETKKEMQERLLYLQEKYEDVQADVNRLNDKIQILRQRQIYLDKENSIKL
jgi:predicted nuclease with TOPRIM domain